MRPFFILLAALFIFSPLPVFAQAEGCNAYVPATIHIQPVFDEVEYETMPMLKIKTLADESKEGTLHEQWPVGIALGEMYMRITTDIQKIRAGYSPSTCGQVKAIHIQFGFKNNKIIVAKEFPKRSCPFKTVLAHEEKHKAVDRAILEEYSKQAERVFYDAAKKIGVIKEAASVLVDEKINSAINAELDRFSKEIEQEHRMRQADIDSKEEYKRVTESCDGLTMETVNQRLEMLELSHPGITKVKEAK